MDRDRYVELLKLKRKYEKMREQLILADVDDEGTDLSKSAAAAWSINERFKKPITKKKLKKMKDNMANDKDLSSIDGPPTDVSNVEYLSMIKILDGLLKDSSAEMREIEEANGIKRQHSEDIDSQQDDPQNNYNILDVFQVEIDN